MAADSLSSTLVASAAAIEEHDWTAMARDFDIVFDGKPYLQKPMPMNACDIPFRQTVRL
ncbi:uncharacterized protein BCR38DRAFT_491994 [Pseudomassariella vexata]|uniref:Uncharacterized protein n=1 Tax=Pseudomassariella vexata TaxID=1141098 RepID=A0A1Y2EHN2_9PEZI|nr:uncharacterized protein BCR38DRAFT_491994 [Pseudomassariella vexata]ORY71080.1 hypothetical protein BCR38DRAFT_491994 [Pseudomassariella vexata]